MRDIRVGTTTFLVLIVALLFLLSFRSANATITITQLPTVTGALSVTSTVSATVKGWFIDDPLDPRNKILYHANVESPNVKNLYDGIATLDGAGAATVELPAYFLLLNQDFRYLLTPIGQPMPNLHIGSEVGYAYFGMFGPITFSIAGGVAGGSVSWQVTGIRHDPYILANPVVPEVVKGPDQLRDKGKYICPECYGK